MTEWAEKHRIVSSERTANPGPFRAWPFQREPMDVLSPHDPTEFVILMCAIQMLKTTAFENAIGCAIDQDPGPILLIQPRESDAEEFSKQSIDPMFRDTPVLRDKVVVKKSRDVGNTIDQKRFRGGSLVMLGAQTEENFMMRSIRYALGDEVDRWPRSFKREGSVVGLFINRTANFRGHRKVALASTPTVLGESVIAEWFELSDQRRFHVPCPFCGFHQVLKWEQVRWGDDVLAHDAHYECVSCEQKIPHWRKAWMLERGRWIKENPDSEIAGFHLSRLYSPITPWGDLAVEFLAAKDDPAQLQKFVNTKLAEPWAHKGDSPDWEVIASRAEQYEKGTCPQGVLFLTAGVDIQRDRIEVQVNGWGRGKQRWLVDYRVIWGDTAQRNGEVWRALQAMLAESWPHNSGAQLPILRMAVDTGDAQSQTNAYDFCRVNREKVIAIKGQATGVALLNQPQTSEASARRKKRGGLLLWGVNVSLAKQELYGHLRMKKPEDGTYPDGWFHHYRESDEFYQQLTAEKLVMAKNKKGYDAPEWQKTGRNEALDTANYNRAAAEHVGISKWGEARWKALEESFRPKPPGVKPEPEPAKAEPQAQQEKPKTASRPGWLQGGGSWLRR